MQSFPFIDGNVYYQSFKGNTFQLTINQLIHNYL